MAFPIDAVRSRFPALAVTDDGRERVYFDAPGGTQVCRDAVDAMTRHLATPKPEETTRRTLGKPASSSASRMRQIAAADTPVPTRWRSSMSDR